MNGNINAERYKEILDENLWPVIAWDFPGESTPVHSGVPQQEQCYNHLSLLFLLWLTLLRNLSDFYQQQDVFIVIPKIQSSSYLFIKSIKRKLFSSTCNTRIARTRIFQSYEEVTGL